MTSQVILRPLRFTADVPAMRTFLETLGLRSRIESERGGWVDMVAGRGMTALHDSASSATCGRPGETRLSFEADDLADLSARLRDAGYDDATVWDEAYGRVLSVTAADATTIWIDERSNDLYGYRRHDARPDERWSVTPLLQVGDQPGWKAFFGVLGGDIPDLIDYGPSGGGGPVAGADPVAGDPVAGADRTASFGVQLAFRTAEPLAEVERRLVGAGCDPARDGAWLIVVDPDGRPVTVSAQAAGLTSTALEGPG